MRVLLVVGLFLASQIVLEIPAPAQADGAGSDHVFECGMDEPPSGTYLNLGLGQSFYYDCETRLLTPQEAGIVPKCVYAPGGPPGDNIPLYGLCLIFDPVHDLSGNELDDYYQIKVHVAVAGGFGTVSWKDFHNGAQYNNCAAAPCSNNPTDVCTYVLDLVTFCTDGWNQGIGGCPPAGWVYVSGRIEASNVVRTIQATHANGEYICE